MATIRVTNLRLRTIIGINDWEREKKQDIIINITIQFDAGQSSDSDNIEDTIDYKTLTKKIIQTAENSQYFLLEKLGDVILNIILEHPLVHEATVKIDKPQALRFADSVSLELTKNK